jgi:hypothetical protein
MFLCARYTAPVVEAEVTQIKGRDDIVRSRDQPIGQHAYGRTGVPDVLVDLEHLSIIWFLTDVDYSSHIRKQ